MNSREQNILLWFSEHQPEMKVEIITPETARPGTIYLESRIVATGRYTLTINNTKYGYELLIVIPSQSDEWLIPVVYCSDKKLYPALNRHILSDRKACLGSWLDILKIMKTGKGFPDFAEKIIDPFIAWQLYYDTFGKPPAWGERMHGFSGEVEAIVDHLSSIWNLSPERLSRMLFEYKPKKRKKCFCGSKKQFRYCHGKYFYPIRSKITTIKEMTPDECKRNFVKEEMILLKTILELPSLPNVLY